MSDFECRNGHLMRGTTCDICGGTAYRMDGMTGRQWAKLEAGEYDRPDDVDEKCENEDE